ncbi:hypothetical protein [Gloeocapsa sp. PCC 7428]|uniref:hypothetical protein n=1 Tax=Gloeocapsa sp. PCC 7428 TaxID=1173026 RepID=UPI0002F7781A|nr:hypothetical protein [Gloeocapsa sp. PCC 7428]
MTADVAEEIANRHMEAARYIQQVITQVYVAEKTDEDLHKLLKSSTTELLLTLQLTADNKN